MNVLILGATGRVGSCLLSYALRDRHQVTALVRTTAKLQMSQEHLTTVTGNVLNEEDVVRAMSGTDAVMSALSTDGTTTLSESMPIIVEAMKREGITRIITIGTAGILQSRTEPHLLRYQSSESKRKLTRAAEEHHQVYNTLSQSGLDWTIVCPTYLPDGEHTGSYRVERNFLPEGGTLISVQDTADFAYKQLADSTYGTSRVGIAY